MQNTIPMPMQIPIPLPMPYSNQHSINLNIPNINNNIPAYAQTLSRINPISQQPQQFGQFGQQLGQQFGQLQQQYGQQQPVGYLPMNPYEYTNGQVPFLPLDHTMGHQMGYGLQAGYPMGHVISINKPTKYNINVSTGNIGDIKKIYKDLLPKNDTIHDRYATISERLNFANYISLLFKKHYYNYNEDDIRNKISDITQNETLTYLLGHIKINTINSNKGVTSTFTNISNSRDNMIIFNVCHPIDLNYYNQIVCKDDSVQSHLRIYRLFDILTNENDQIKHLNNVILELFYYNKIKELIKNKKYPNFALSYGEFFAQCRIDFDGMTDLRKTAKNNSINISATGASGNNCLLMLTESFNSNMEDWAKIKYVEKEPNDFFVNVSEVIHTGYRTEEVWKSVLFQLIFAKYVLHKEKISFTNFTLKENVFMHKFKITPPGIKYWKYIINGAQYYVPNNEWLVMISSDFSDNNIINIDRKGKYPFMYATIKKCHTMMMYNEKIENDIKNATISALNYIITKETLVKDKAENERDKAEIELAKPIITPADSAKYTEIRDNNNLIFVAADNAINESNTAIGAISVYSPLPPPAPPPPPVSPFVLTRINVKAYYIKTDEEIVDEIKRLLLTINVNASPLPESIQTLITDITGDATITTIDFLFAKYFYKYLCDKMGYIISEKETETNEYLRLLNDNDLNIGDLVFYNFNNDMYSISTIIKNENNRITIMTNKNINNYDESTINCIDETAPPDSLIKFRYKSTKEIIETYIM